VRQTGTELHDGDGKRGDIEPSTVTRLAPAADQRAVVALGRTAEGARYSSVCGSRLDVVDAEAVEGPVKAAVEARSLVLIGDMRAAALGSVWQRLFTAVRVDVGAEDDRFGLTVADDARRHCAEPRAGSAPLRRQVLPEQWLGAREEPERMST
jgi:hypothetical protein